MKKITIFIVALTLCLADAFSATLTVGSGKTYATIQAAVTAASPGDVIDVAAGTYTEKNILCSKSVTIQGAGMGNTFVQADASKTKALTASCSVFTLDANYSTNATITIKNMTIQNGYNAVSGGGIRMNQTGTGTVTLNLYGLRISDNRTNVNGAGVMIQGNVVLNIEKCNISANTASATGGVGGAGICINQTSAPVNLSIKNSTISNNTAAGGNGGAIYTACTTSPTSSIWMENTTIYGNKNNTTAKNGGGIYVSVGTSTSSVLTMNHCTMVNNSTKAGTGGDGIYVNEAGGSTSLVINNSIIHKNTGSTSNAASQVYGQITNGGVTNSIIGLPASGTWLHSSGTNTKNKLDAVDADLAFANILSYDDTPVLLLNAGSIAKNYIQTDLLTPALTLDQLDATRDATPDAGAVEYSADALLSLTSNWEVSTTATNSGKSWTTVAAALSRCLPGDTIDVAAGTYTEKNILCTKSVTIRGAGMDNTIVQGYSGTKPAVTADSPVFSFTAAFNSATSITLKDMTVQNGYNLYNGGGVRLSNTGTGIVTLNLTNLKITNNRTGILGGGVSLAGRSVVIIDKCYITDNTTTGTGNNNGNGGGMAITTSTVGVPNVTIKNSTISNNVATKGGGTSGSGGNGAGISLETGTYITSLIVENSTIVGNSSVSAGRTGGGIYVKAGVGATPTVTLNHCTVANNTTNAGTGGDGVSVDAAGESSTTLVINNSIIHKNTGSTSNADSQVFGLITNGGVTNSIIGLPASATWLHDSGTNTNNKLDALDTDLAFASSLSADATPVLTIGSSSIARNYVNEPNLVSDLTKDQIGTARVAYPDAGAYESTVSAFIINASAATGGVVASGVGSYDEGTSATVVASANPGYVFANWSENGVPVSTSTSYNFIVSSARELVANFSVDLGTGFERNVDNKIVLIKGRQLLFSGNVGIVEIYNSMGGLVAVERPINNTITLKSCGVFIIKVRTQSDVKMQKVIVD